MTSEYRRQPHKANSWIHYHRNSCNFEGIAQAKVSRSQIERCRILKLKINYSVGSIRRFIPALYIRNHWLQQQRSSWRTSARSAGILSRFSQPILRGRIERSRKAIAKRQNLADIIGTRKRIRLETQQKYHNIIGPSVLNPEKSDPLGINHRFANAYERQSPWSEVNALFCMMQTKKC